MVKRDKKEVCFELIDAMIDDGIDVTCLGLSLRGNAKYKYETVRKKLQRAFGSVQQALIEYGLFEGNGVPSELELHRCFYINDKYKVCLREEERDLLLDLYNITELEFNRLTKGIYVDIKRDALDEYYRNEFPDNIKNTFIELEDYKHLKGYIYTFFSGVQEFLEYYGAPSSIFVERNTYAGAGTFIKAGYAFEILVKDILDTIYGKVEYQNVIGDCRPDFIINGQWIDAKLSYKTVFHPQCKTLPKYLTKTNHIKIIYARNKCKQRSFKGVTLLHISEYYEDLLDIGRSDLVERCERFLANLEESEAC